MNFTPLLSDTYVLTFLLLFVRFGSLFVFFPMLNHQSLLVQVKAALTFYLAIIFYTQYPPILPPDNFLTFMFMVLSEILFGFLAGVLLQISFGVLAYAGELIAFVMGFTMASVMDPQTGSNTPIIANILNLVALMVFFALNVHHDIIIFMYNSLDFIPLGGFVTTSNMPEFIINASKEIFLVGFSIAFPVIALSLLMDIIFGMIMKTMPQMNLLVIGFPIKITISFIVIIATVRAILEIFGQQFLKIFNQLPTIFFTQ